MKRIILLSIFVILVISTRSYSQTGPTGPTGPAGYNGQNGMDGATGATGACGTAGRDGRDGTNGATGVAGQQGEQGISGVTGPTGEQGLQGPTGHTGPTGATGATGGSGNNGTNSVVGSDKQIQFNDNGSFGGAVRFIWNKTNNFVGINNTTASYNLDVTGTASVNGSIYYNLSGANAGDFLQWGAGSLIQKVTGTGLLSYLGTTTIPNLSAGTITVTDVNPSGANAGDFLQRNSNNSGTQWVAGSSINNYSFYDLKGGNFYITPDGGYASLYINDTGGSSVKGTVVSISSNTDNAVSITSASGTDQIGIMYSDGVANGGNVWVVTVGTAYVLLKDYESCVKKNYLIVSNSAGRAITGTSRSTRGIGVANESKGSAQTSNVLVKTTLEFN